MNSRSTAKVFIYVQHLLGIGHLQRALELAQAIKNCGLCVDLVSGGRPTKKPIPEGINFHQLTPVHCADAQFNELLDDADQPVSEHWKQQRRDSLIDLFDTINPDVLITETYPFGRRMMRFELLPLLKRAKQTANPPLIVSSIRDILQPKSREDRNLEIVEMIDQHFDQVLVHGDDSIATLDQSFPKAHSIQSKLNYTGYIYTRPESTATTSERFDIIVSAGGSNTGSKIIQTTIDAAKRLKAEKSFASMRWLILVSPAFDDHQFNVWQSQQIEGLVISRNRPDFDQLLAASQLSISQAGYNTVMSILDANIRSIVIPFDDGNEKEQTIRAQVLSDNQALQSLSNADLNVDSLVETIVLAFNQPEPQTRYKMQGANQSAVLIQQWLKNR